MLAPARLALQVCEDQLFAASWTFPPGRSGETAFGARSMESGNQKTILFAFGANLLIAAAKLVRGFFTGSSALLAEAAHPIADRLNHVFLLVSLSLGRRRPDETHPFGHGMERVF